MKSLDSIINRWKEKLSSIYDPGEAEQITFLVLEEVMKLRRVDVSLRKNEIVQDSIQICLEAILRKLLEGVPVQYVLGFSWFDGLRIEVNSHVLIPRQETEELVSWVVKEPGTQMVSPVILDICSGSGCIGLALKKHFPQAKIIGIDVSDEALNCSRQNSIKLNLPVEYLELDVLSISNLPVKADVIVSNPPYVKQSEATEMLDRVLRYEPHLALFVPDSEALIFYRKIAKLSLSALNESGILFFEINESLGNETASLLSDLGFKDIQLRKDLNGKFRMIRAVK